MSEASITIQDTGVGPQATITFPGGESLVVTPDPSGKPIAEVRSRGFASLCIRPKVSNVITLSVQDL